MAELTATYDPSKVTVTVDGETLMNFADDTFIECEKSADTYGKHVGVDGKVTRTKSADPTGQVKITLAHNSPSNKKLMELAKNGTICSISITDGNFEGSVGVSGSEAWIIKPADFKRGKEVEDKEWTFAVADYEAMFDADDAGMVGSEDSGGSSGGSSPSMGIAE